MRSETGMRRETAMKMLGMTQGASISRRRPPMWTCWLALDLLLTVPAAAQNLVKNGDFNAQTATTVYPGYEAITYWTSSNTNYTGLNLTTGGAFADNGVPPDAGNVAFIQSRSATASVPAEALTQTITGLTAGSTYNLSFSYNARNIFSTPTTLTVTLGGQTVFTSVGLTSEEATGVHTLPYHYATGLYTATGSTADLVFSNQAAYVAGHGSGDSGLNADGTVLLDDVSLTPVPEPSSVAAFGFTFLGAAGLMLRARKRKASARA